MKSLAFLSFLILSHISVAQEIDWTIHFDSPQRQSFVGLEHTSNDDIVLCLQTYGDFYPNIQDNSNVLQPLGSIASVIAKYSSGGEYLWSFILTSEQHVKITNTTIDLDDNIIVVGEFTNNASLDLDPSSNEFIIENTLGPNHSSFIAKYDTDGNFLWGKQSLNGSSAVHFVTHDENNNVYVASRYQGSILAYDGMTNLNSEGTGADMFISKLNPQGETSWIYNVRSSDKVQPASIQYNNDRIFINCYFNVDIKLEEDAFFEKADGADYIVFSLDLNGNYDTAIHFESTGNFYMNSMQFLEDDLLVAGFFNESFTYSSGSTLQSEDANDAFVMRVSKTGDVHWIHQGAGAGLDNLYLHGFTPDGNILLAAYYEDTFSFQGKNYTSAGKRDFTLMELNTEGNFLTSFDVATEENDILSNMSYNSSKSFLAVSQFTNEYNLNILHPDDPILAFCDDDADLFLIQYNPKPVSISNLPNQQNLHVYPNPTHDNCFVESTDLHAIGLVTLYNAQGQMLFSLNFDQQQKTSIELPYLQGIYYLKTRDGYHKIIKL